MTMQKLFRFAGVITVVAAALGARAFAGAEPAHARFHELPLTAIEPKGWLRGYLQTQSEGLTGHLEAAGYPFNTVGWEGESIPNNTSVEDWWPYEQNAYWVDAMERCGVLLRDEVLLRKAARQIDYVLSHPAPNGYLGPLFGGKSSDVNRWIHAVFFRALMAAYEDGRHPAIPEALRRHYLAGDEDYSAERESMNIEAMLWTYAKTGDRALLELAEKAYATGEKTLAATATAAPALLEDKPATGHGVTFNERAKLGAILYMHTGKADYLAPSVAAFRKLDKYHMLIGGVNVSSEHLHPVTDTEAYEICDIADYTWSAGYLLMATGETRYADRIERAVFNAVPGSVRNDFKALQYFSAPNQVVCTRTSFPRSGGPQMSFAPNPGTECCPANVNRCMPNFVARLWMRGNDGSLAAVMYGPSVVRAPAGPSGDPVTIEEQTEYPFSDTITFRVRTAKPVKFALQLRIPEWAKGASIMVNGKDHAASCTPGTFARVEAAFADGDVIVLRLPQALELVRGPRETVSVVRGPLVYSLLVREKWDKVPEDPRSTPEFPAYNLTAASSWNYALVEKPAAQLAVDEVRRSVGSNPWSIETAPIELRVQARQLRDWKIVPQHEVVTERWDVERDPKTNKVTRWFIAGHDKVKGNFLYTPEVPGKDAIPAQLAAETETVTLIPYGCAKLRVTYFPVAR